jgi:plasmid stabilization system protein ParE
LRSASQSWLRNPIRDAGRLLVSLASRSPRDPSVQRFPYPRFAIDLNDKLRAASRSLSENPLRGVALFTPKRQIRRLVEGGHVILYAADNEIMILRILHGSRDVAAIVADMD